MIASVQSSLFAMTDDGFDERDIRLVKQLTHILKENKKNNAWYKLQIIMKHSKSTNALKKVSSVLRKKKLSITELDQRKIIGDKNLIQTAAYNGFKKMTKFLIEKKANPYVLTSEGKTLVDLANDRAVVRQLLKRRMLLRSKLQNLINDLKANPHLSDSNQIDNLIVAEMSGDIKNQFECEMFLYDVQAKEVKSLHTILQEMKAEKSIKFAIEKHWIN